MILKDTSRSKDLPAVSESLQCHLNHKFENFTFFVQCGKKCTKIVHHDNFFFPSCTNTNTIAVYGRCHSCRRRLNSLPNDLVVTEFAQVSFFSICFVSQVKTRRDFNCQNCDLRGRVACKCC